MLDHWWAQDLESELGEPIVISASEPDLQPVELTDIWADYTPPDRSTQVFQLKQQRVFFCRRFSGSIGRLTSSKRYRENHITGGVLQMYLLKWPDVRFQSIQGGVRRGS